VNPDTPNVLQTMMQFHQANTRAKNANKIFLETEKEQDADEKTVEELKRQIQPKRPHTHDDDGDAQEDVSWYVSWYHELRREEVRVAHPQVGGVQGHQVLRRGQCPRR